MHLENKKLILNIYLLGFIVLFFKTINASSYRRFRRQINSLQNNRVFYQPQPVRFKTPSGSIMGTTYYGVGSDPNYGSHIARPNSANGGDFSSISYNPNSNAYGYLINPSHSHQQNSLHTNNHNINNAGLGYNSNHNNNLFYNRYPPGSEGWYATGVNYLNTDSGGQSRIAHSCPLLISILILIFCK